MACQGAAVAFAAAFRNPEVCSLIVFIFVAAGCEVAMACHGAAVAFAGGLGGGLGDLYAAAGAAQHLRLSG